MVSSRVLALLVAAMVVPYVMLTFRFATSELHRPPIAESRLPLELDGYYAAIESATRLLRDLEERANATRAAESGGGLSAAHYGFHGARAGAATAAAFSFKSAAPAAAPAGGAVRDLVIGLAKEIPLKNLAVFAASLRVHAPDAHLALFVDAASLSETLAALALEQRVELLPYVPNELQPPSLRSFHASSFRWPLQAAYLRRHALSGFRGVLFADVRDTAFQADPFAAILQPHAGGVFYAFHGVESRTIGECGWNGGWIKDCFGEAKRKSLASKPIVCSGVSIATFAEALAYAEQMSAVISDPAFAKCERNGVDQGVHNVLLHEQRVAGALIVSQRTALVANLQAKVASVERDVVRNPRRDLVAVVHQYDRFPNLAQSYYTRWAQQMLGDAVDSAKACAKYAIRDDVDLFKAKCDLAVAGGSSAADCCLKCDANARCNAWSLSGSLCYLKTCTQPATNVRMPGVLSAVRTQR